MSMSEIRPNVVHNYKNYLIYFFFVTLVTKNNNDKQ